MKKLIILFLIPFVIFAQNYDVSVKSAKNSTTTTLDSAATYTGTEELTRGYNSLSVTVRSDSAGTYKILFGNSSSITTANAIKTWSFSYTAGDTLHTKHVPIVAPYYKVVYTSSADTQNVFLLTTMLHQGHNLPTNSSAEIQVADATVEATLTNIEADADSTVDMTTAIKTAVEIMDDWDESDRAKVNPIVGQAGVAANRGTASATTQRVTIANDDTTSTLQTAIKTAVELLDNAVDGNYLNTNVNFAGADATVNIGNADATTQRVVLASDQPTIPVTLSPTDTVTVKSIVNALPAGTNAIGKLAANSGVDIGDVDILSIAAGTNNIGDVDVASLPAGNLGMQLMAASLSVVPASNITDATYIGDIKFGESLPAGTNLLGSVGIDQTTDGTTNKVRAFQPTHDNLNANTNIQVGDADVANGNPVPVSDAGGSLTVDGTVAVSSLAGNSTFANNAIAITTAAQLHSNTACKTVTVTNYTAGEYVYVGNASVSTANGFPLGYLDSITLTVSNLNLVYVVSDGTSCDIRFSYEN